MMPTKDGNIVQVTLKKALYIPSYPHNIFSVNAATKSGAEIKLQCGQNLMTKDKTTFEIEETLQTLVVLITVDFINT